MSRKRQSLKEGLQGKASHASNRPLEASRREVIRERVCAETSAIPMQLWGRMPGPWRGQSQPRCPPFQLPACFSAPLGRERKCLRLEPTCYDMTMRPEVSSALLACLCLPITTSICITLVDGTCKKAYYEAARPKASGGGRSWLLPAFRRFVIYLCLSHHPRASFFSTLTVIVFCIWARIPYTLPTLQLTSFPQGGRV